MQTPMAPYAFHPGWIAPRRSVHDKIRRSVHNKLGNNNNRSYHHNEVQRVWCPMSPTAGESTSVGQNGRVTDRGTVIIGTHELSLGEPVVDGSVASRTAPHGENVAKSSIGVDIAEAMVGNSNKNGGCLITTGSSSKSVVQPVLDRKSVV